MVVRDYLEVFREIMRDPRWKGLFDLIFRAIFDDLGNRLIGPACSALAWERIQAILGSLIPIGFSQLYFDATFMGQNGTVRVRARPFADDTFHGSNPQVYL